MPNARVREIRLLSTGTQGALLEIRAPSSVLSQFEVVKAMSVVDKIQWD